MDDYDVYQSLETEQQFFEELDDVVATQYTSHDLIDETLRSWLHLASMFRNKFCEADENVFACAQKLISSQIFVDNQDYVRTQILYSLLQEDEPSALHVITCFLLLDGQANEATFTRMVGEACFPRLLELINGRKERDPRLHRMLLELMYDMSRVERLRTEDLLQVDDGFVNYLFQIIEELSNDVHDPYHYPIIRVLLILNEQYMLASANVAVDPLSPSAPLTNRVLKCLSLYGDSFRTFGENIILLLNRETETSQQLLILKLLYLLFTTKATQEYFYTNDLKVLLDVIIRNLMDLPDEKSSLRHTYLRVLYPLLAHTQLSHPPHYKRDEVLKVLRILRGQSGGGWHFAPADETTLRLVERVAKVDWLAEEEDDDATASRSGSASGAGEGEMARKLLGISLTGSQGASNVSVVDVAAVMEKPGVQTPSRNAPPPLGEGAEAAGATADGAPVNATGAAEDGNAKSRRTAPPQVPRHRHGLPFRQVPTLHINGKKTPPQAPPPRRQGRRKHSVEPASDLREGDSGT